MYIYTNYVYIILYCLILTLILEMFIAFILKLRKKDLVNVLLVNILTNPLINCIHPLFLFKYGKNVQIICLLILEILVVFVEGFIYKKTLNYKKLNGYILALILNLISFTIGAILNYFIF